MTTSPEMLTLDQAATLIPNATRGTLLRRIRQGKLDASRPGKEYLTTEAAVKALVDKCRVVPKVRDCGSARTETHGLSSTVHASAALDAALATVRVPNAR
jgi:excisionase family DNA binding protein